MRVLITGGAGLTGSECCRLFSQEGWKVISVDNYMRGKLFGKEGNTKNSIRDLEKTCDIEHHEMDIRDERIRQLIKKADLVIHTAAQPSHPKSIEIPFEDFQINALGTLFLLENLRKYNPKAAFIFCSTNKVYGETPNYFSYKKVGKRFEPEDIRLSDGFDEKLRIDMNMHTPFAPFIFTTHRTSYHRFMPIA